MEHCLVYYTHRGAFWHKNLYTNTFMTRNFWPIEGTLTTHFLKCQNPLGMPVRGGGGGVHGNSHWLVHHIYPLQTYLNEAEWLCNKYTGIYIQKLTMSINILIFNTCCDAFRWPWLICTWVHHKWHIWRQGVYKAQQLLYREGRVLLWWATGLSLCSV